MSDRRRIYVDHNASSPIRPEVLDVLHGALARVHGNASSLHAAGADARRLVAEARAHVAALVDAAPREVVFTSGGTEANNLAIAGAIAALERSPVSICVGATEHHSVLRVVEALNPRGVEVRSVPVNGDGLITTAALEGALDGASHEVALVSIGWANNETGVIQDVRSLARVARARGARVHCDAVQAAGRHPIQAWETGVDLLSLSAHKLGGPKGAGALVVRDEAPLRPILHGGGQERGLRSGTLDVPAIAGFGVACRSAHEGLDTHVASLRALTAVFETGVVAYAPTARVHGAGAPRLPGTTSVGFAGADAEALLIALDLRGVCASAGAACTTGAVEPSHVLGAMGVDPALARGTIRVSFGWSNVPADAVAVLDALAETLPVHSRA